MSPTLSWIAGICSRRTSARDWTAHSCPYVPFLRDFLPDGNWSRSAVLESGTNLARHGSAQVRQLRRTEEARILTTRITAGRPLIVASTLVYFALDGGNQSVGYIVYLNSNGKVLRIE